MTCLFAILLVYSQTAAFAWDEGYQVLAAQLIAHGRRPYLDFFFPQAPLNAWWNAAAMRMFGETWREVHALSAAVTAGTILLAADFVYTRFPVSAWRLPGAIAAALLIGLQANFIEFTTTGQPYALCLFLTVAAFRVSVVAVERGPVPGLSPPVRISNTAGAANTGLNTGLVSPPRRACWRPRPRRALSWCRRRRGSAGLDRAPGPQGTPPGQAFRLPRRRGGSIPPGALVVRPRSPQVFFNLFQYHLFYRRANWEDATPHDWKVLTSWLTSPQALVLGLLAAAGLWHSKRRSDFSLCGWLALAIGAELSITHPTFEWTHPQELAEYPVIGIRVKLPPGRKQNLVAQG